MNRISINRSWLGRGAWSALVLFAGLLLGACEPAGAGDGTRAPGDGTGAPGNTGQGATDFKTLPAECLEVNVDGEITAFHETKVDCELKEFTIPNEKDGAPITVIGENIFKGKSLTKLSIPKGVKTIGTNAFSDNDLTDLRISDSVKTIGESAFNKNKLTELTIPGSVETIGKNAFSENELTSLIIPNKVKTIGESAFNKNKLTELTIPNSVTSIGENAFFSNPDLVTVVLDPSPELSFSSSSFPGDLWTPFRQRTPKKAETWFLGGDPLAWVFSDLPVNCLSVDADGTITKFYNTRAGCAFTALVIPPKKGAIQITAIGNYAFQGKSLTNLTIPNSVKTIGSYAFDDNELTSLSMPNSVETIRYAAFRNNQLTSLSIPNSVETIGEAAFADNELTSLRIPNRVKAIGSRAFQENRLIGLTIGNSVETIGKEAFWDNRLKNLTIPNSVKTIRYRAFRDNHLTSLSIGNSVETIGEAAFYNNQLRSLTIPNSVKTIGDNAFRDNHLTSLSIPNTVETIGSYAFSSNRFTSLSIPDGMETIEEYAFSNNQLTRLTIPDSVEAIEEGAFADNPNLVRVTLDPNANLFFYTNSFPGDLWTLFNRQRPKKAGLWTRGGSLPAWTFALVLPAGCLIVDAGGTITKFNNTARTRCALTEFAIPPKKGAITITAIGNNAFQYKSLTLVIIPDSVETIGAYAFFYNKLAHLSIGNSVTSIGSGAFAFNNPTLVTVVINPNPRLSFDSSSFPYDLWTPFSRQNPKRRGTWTRSGTTWRFRAN